MRIVQADFYDAELQRHNEQFRVAAGVRPGDHVLDIGCGTGQSTRHAARAVIGGSALGVDISGPMLERARQLSDDEWLRNVAYQQADAQSHPFPSAHFDLGISRFGTIRGKPWRLASHRRPLHPVACATVRDVVLTVR